MLRQAFYFILVLSPVLSRNVPRFADLDEDDQHLYRAAYDTPSYDHDEYEYEEEGNKLDLVKDGLWAIKAKLKELKAFDKALAANMLATKIKVKDLLENHLGELKHHHHDKKKPSYSYQAPSYHQPQYPAPQYGGAGVQYPAPQYGHDPYYGH